MIFVNELFYECYLATSFIGSHQGVKSEGVFVSVFLNLAYYM